MSLIGTAQFLAIVDRLAAQYSQLSTAYTEVNQPATAATLLVGTQQKATAELVGDDGLRIVLQALTPGVEGNSIKIQSVVDGVDQEFAAGYFGNEWVLYNATDGSGDIATPMDLLYQLCQEHPSLTALFEVKAVIFPVSLIGQPATVLLFGASEEETSFDLNSFLSSSILEDITPFYGGFAEDAFRVSALVTGYTGREISLTLEAPTAGNQELTITVTGKAIVVELASNGLSETTTTAAELVEALNADLAASQLITASLVNGSGTAVVAALEQTYLGVGYTGGLENVILSCTGGISNKDLVSTVLEAAQFLDESLTITNVANAGVGWTNLIAGLEAHFALMSQTGLLPGYLSDNTLRVHRDFATLYLSATGGALDAVSVFRPDRVKLGKATVVGSTVVLSETSSLGTGTGLVSTTNYAAQKLEAVLTPASVKAAETFLTGTAGLTFTAKYAGEEGNNITIEYREPSSHPSPLTIEAYPYSPVTQSRQIIVHLETDEDEEVVSTALEVKAALEADAVASEIIDVALVGNGSGVVEGVAETALTDGVGLDLTAGLNMTVTVRTGASSTDTLVIDHVRFSAGDPPLTTQPLTPRARVTLNSQFRVVAVEAGLAGNSITIEVVNPGVPNASLGVEIVGKAITVSLATNGASSATTTLTTLKAALDFYASELVYTDLLISGATVVSTVAQTSLSGGAAAPRAFAVTAVALNGQLGTDSDKVEFYQIVEREVTP